MRQVITHAQSSLKWQDDGHDAFKRLNEYLKEFPDFWLNPEEGSVDNKTQRDLKDNNSNLIALEEAPCLPWVRLSHIVSIYRY